MRFLKRHEQWHYPSTQSMYPTAPVSTAETPVATAVQSMCRGWPSRRWICTLHHVLSDLEPWPKQCHQLREWNSHAR